ncbi:MAG TPA: PadR family transcriptional regulator [Paenibacillus sp.]
MNTLSYGLLAFLSRAPYSGYDLMLKLQPYWPAKHSQIYPILSQMESDHLLTSTWIKQCEKPDKKIYNITENGIRMLKEWMYIPLADPITRDELSMKTYCMWMTNIDNAIDIIERREAYYLKRLNIFNLLLEDMPEEKREFGNHEFYDYLLVQKGVYSVSAGLEWTRMMLETLKNQRTKQQQL